MTHSVIIIVKCKSLLSPDLVYNQSMLVSQTRPPMGKYHSLLLVVVKSPTY